MNCCAEKPAFFQNFSSSNLCLLVFAPDMQPSSGNSQQPDECQDLVPSACGGVQHTMQHPWARTPVRSNKEAGLVPASHLPSAGPLPAGCPRILRTAQEAMPNRAIPAPAVQHHLAAQANFLWDISSLHLCFILHT